MGIQNVPSTETLRQRQRDAINAVLQEIGEEELQDLQEIVEDELHDPGNQEPFNTDDTAAGNIDLSEFGIDTSKHNPVVMVKPIQMVPDDLVSDGSQGLQLAMFNSPHTQQFLVVDPLTFHQFEV